MDQTKLPTNEELAKKMAEAKGWDEYPSYHYGLHEYWCSRTNGGNNCICRTCLSLNMSMFFASFACVIFIFYAAIILVGDPAGNWPGGFPGWWSIFLLPMIILTSATGASIWWKRRKTYNSCLEQLATEKVRLQYLLPIIRQMTIDAFDQDLKEFKKIEGIYLNEYIGEELRPRDNESNLSAQIKEKKNQLMNELGMKIMGLELEKANAVRKIEEGYHALVLGEMDAIHNAKMPTCDRSEKMISIVNSLLGSTPTTPAPSVEPPLAPLDTPPPPASADVSCSDVVAS